MPYKNNRFALLTQDSANKLNDERSRIQSTPYTRYRTPEGLTLQEGVYAQLTVNNNDGSYQAQQVQWSGGGWTTYAAGVTWDSTTGGPGYLYALQGNTSYATGLIVHAWAWGDENGNTIWLFDEYLDDITQLCYGSWTIEWDVSPGHGAIEGELNITSGYTHIYVHRIDNQPAWRQPWLAQFKVGDIVKIATTGSGVGALFEIVNTSLTGDYYTWEIDVCDISNKALILDGVDVQVCLGLNCVDSTIDVDITEGPGIDVVESPVDEFKISCLLEEGTCIDITEQGDGQPIIISVDLDCIGAGIDWTSYISVCDSIEWKGSPDNCIHLVGDEATPPDYTLYSYGDSLLPRGWHYLNDFLVDTNSIRVTSPTGQEVELEVATQKSITEDAGGIKLVNDESSPSEYTLYGQIGSRGWQDIAEYFDSSSTISKSGGGGSLLEFNIEFTADSSVVDNGGVELYNDENAPGNHHFYGVDDVGSKGWHNFTQVTVVTDVQVDGANNEFEKKTRTLYVFDPGSESAWTVWHTGTACS